MTRMTFRAGNLMTVKTEALNNRMIKREVKCG